MTPEEFVTEYVKEFGRPPTLVDLMMMREAEASIALDKDDA